MDHPNVKILSILWSYHTLFYSQSTLNSEYQSTEKFTIHVYWAVLFSGNGFWEIDKGCSSFKIIIYEQIINIKHNKWSSPKFFTIISFLNPSFLSVNSYYKLHREWSNSNYFSQFNMLLTKYIFLNFWSNILSLYFYRLLPFHSPMQVNTLWLIISTCLVYYIVLCVCFEHWLFYLFEALIHMNNVK